MSILKWSFPILLCLLISGVSSAAKAGEAKEGEKKAEKKEGEKKETPEWMELQTQISTLDARRQQKQEAIAKAILEKRNLPPNSPQIKVVIDQMVQDYNEMRHLNDEMEKKMTVLKFRFPEKGLAE